MREPCPKERFATAASLSSSASEGRVPLWVRMSSVNWAARGEADLPRHRDDVLAPRLEPEMDEEGVAGDLDRLLEVDVAVPVAPVAVEDMPADVRVPLAGVPLVAAHAAFERGGRHHQLEGRTHVILREGAVDKRAVGVLQACREVVRVVGRHRDGCLDVARGDVHHHRRALFDPLHRPLGDPLEIRVEGERDAPLALVVVPQHLGRVEGEGVSRRVEGVAQLELPSYCLSRSSYAISMPAAPFVFSGLR